MIQPTKSTLYNPTMWQNLEAFFRALYNLQLALEITFNPIFQFFSLVARIRPDALQPGQQAFDGPEKQLGSVAVLNIALVNNHAVNQPQRIDQNVAFAAFYLLARIIAANPPFSAVFTDWLSIIPALGCVNRPCFNRNRSRKIP